MPPVRRNVGSPIPPEDLEDAGKVAAGYAHWVQNGGYSDETKRAYASRAAAFCAWVDEHPHHRAPDVFVDEHARDFALRDYRNHLVNIGRLPRGVDASMSAALRLSKWLGLAPPETGMFAPTASRLLMMPKHLPPDAAMRVLREAEHRGPRELCLFAIGIFGGLRVGELHRLNVENVHSTRDGGLMDVLGKGGKWRKVPIHKRVVAPLETWQRERRYLPGAHDERALFLARSGGRLAVRSMHELVANVGKAVGIEGLHPHLLRHTYGRGMVQAGVPLRDLQASLGHASLSTTAIYTAPTAEELAKEMNKWDLDW